MSFLPVRPWREARLFGTVVVLLGLAQASSAAGHKPTLKHEEYKLVWADEFDKPGKVDTSVWNFEKGFVRNIEDQWYQEENAWCENGDLIIEGRREKKPNPLYDPSSSDWRKKDEYIEYTSSSINTEGKKSWKYGRFVMRAKFDTDTGLWPAFWTLGVQRPWPSSGEIDIMEYNQGNVWSNVILGSQGKEEWHQKMRPVASFKDKNWGDKFHIWRMDWDEKEIKLYVDDIVLLQVLVNKLVDPDGFNPFKQPHYILLNLAIGGDSGGDPLRTVFPKRYVIDYVRVYQKQ